MIKKLLIFLVLNFIALAIGGLFTGSGVSSNWYQELNKAPWTPPGWVFGVAWSIIMLAYSWYLSKLTTTISHRFISVLFSASWLLNVAWSPLFFRFQFINLGLVVLTLLFLCILTFFLLFVRKLKETSFLLLPYLVWLGTAFSLNWFIVFNN